MSNLMQRLLPMLVANSVRLRHNRIYRALQQTFAVIFPFVMVGAWAQMLELSVFSRNGFFAVIYNLDNVIPHYNQIRTLLLIIETVTVDLMSVMAAFFVAKYIARSYKKDDSLAELTSVGAFLILNFNAQRNAQSPFQMNNFGYRGLFVAIVFGLLIGWLFRFTRADFEEPSQHYTIAGLISRGLRGTWLTVLILISCVAITYGLSLVSTEGFIGLFYVIFQVPAANIPHVSLRLALVTTINALMWWGGIEGPINPLMVQSGSTTGTANLNYALEHANLFNVPNPITMNTIYHPFASFGGVGMTLALIIATLWVGRSKPLRRIAGLSLLPGLVNISSPVMIGWPVTLNPILLVPFLITPLVNMAIAWVAIRLRLMPPSVYTVPTTTPGPLAAFLGTNGNLVALVVAVICLIVSVLIYAPFVRLAETVSLESAKVGDHHD
ncbi:PTS sugar transporter subunit IIC [Lacticaseibacillus zeae]|uniref:Permease IIC component n=1 Tax=Lacticaseibacillus zeae subsp. silagei TaxID=3068307 RepID=A0ABD7ZAH0_LACZE|nr:MULTISPECIES: PTS transporter subunit EIIC [Lacticaseibacillus]MDE3314342.1 PTS transporter subunit EIIC [Lacticaseibacillus zeae]WLV83974.1 PTS transporter subunit EIIC [Lacticaseibacillus sp. NCIMB 15475]WLV86730.1 PTS transporter subunit EIIC [Lacticaseibacillus sp. NCIMB 15474]